jgi:hypothetical protein
LTTNPAATEPVVMRPTTQELLSGERKTSRLSSPVLTMEVPISWKDSATDNAHWIEGPTPKGQVRLQMTSSGTALLEATVNAIEKKAKAEAVKNPDKMTVVPLHPIGGGAKAMERREVISASVPGADGTTTNSTVVDWSIEIFVPSDKQFTLELLHFNNIPVDQYLQDKTFLEGLLRSLRYDAAGGALK